MASWQYNFTKSLSSAIASIRTEESGDKVIVCYTSNPNKEYIFNCNKETLDEIQMLSMGILTDKVNKSLGKTINSMITEQKLVPVIQQIINKGGNCPLYFKE